MKWVLLVLSVSAGVAFAAPRPKKPPPPPPPTNYLLDGKGGYLLDTTSGRLLAR